MICALTVRNLKAGTFDRFRDAFMSFEDSPPEGWVRFNMVRGIDDPDQVICFGMFDGTLEQLRAGGQEGYEEQLASIAEFVESVGADGLYEVVEDRVLSRA